MFALFILTGFETFSHFRRLNDHIPYTEAQKSKYVPKLRKIHYVRFRSNVLTVTFLSDASSDNGHG